MWVRLIKYDGINKLYIKLEKKNTIFNSHYFVIHVILHYPIYESLYSFLYDTTQALFFRVCKGPDWHPGIFVQFTKENGLAQEAGLRPGDQILECNGVKFMDIPFNEVLK